jgi:D-glycero-D-manno-heptose 1,7-bisphosphate phosphatase
MGVHAGMSRKAVFLDRDGVINRALVRDGKPFPPASLAELEILPGVADALLRLRDAGFLMIVVTNQPDVARGTTSKSVVEAMNEHLKAALPLTDVRVCYHDSTDRCECRKPNPGMLLAAARQHDIDLRGSFLVGDRWRDIEAGERAGCRTIFVDYSYQEKQPDRWDFRVTSLPEAAQAILSAAVTDRHDGD